MAPYIQDAAGVHFPTHARTVVKGKGEHPLYYHEQKHLTVLQ